MKRAIGLLLCLFMLMLVLSACTPEDPQNGEPSSQEATADTTNAANAEQEPQSTPPVSGDQSPETRPEYSKRY